MLGLSVIFPRVDAMSAADHSQQQQAIETTMWGHYYGIVAHVQEEMALLYELVEIRQNTSNLQQIPKTPPSFHIKDSMDAES